MPVQDQRIVVEVFLGAPAGMETEGRALERVVAELNRGEAAEKKIYLDFVTWRTRVAPGMGDPQKIVFDRITPRDVFIGIMWKRPGTPTARAASGTVEEFEYAYSLWERSGAEQGGRPRIFFYFNRKGPMPTSVEECSELLRVLRFRELLRKKGLAWDYEGPSDFERQVRRHLEDVIRRWRAPSQRLPAVLAIGTLAKMVKSKGLPASLAVVVTDIWGFTMLNVTLGAAKCDKIRDEYYALVERLLREHDGLLMNLRGDETGSVFSSAVDACRFTLNLHRELRSIAVRYSPDLLLRIAVGEVQVDTKKPDSLWKTVNYVRDVAKRGIGGQTVVTPEVKAKAEGELKGPVRWHDHGLFVGPDRERVHRLWELLDDVEKQRPRPLRGYGVSDS